MSMFCGVKGCSNLATYKIVEWDTKEPKNQFIRAYNLCEVHYMVYPNRYSLLGAIPTKEPTNDRCPTVKQFQDTQRHSSPV